MAKFKFKEAYNSKTYSYSLGEVVYGNIRAGDSNVFIARQNEYVPISVIEILDYNAEDPLAGKPLAGKPHVPNLHYALPLNEKKIEREIKMEVKAGTKKYIVVKEAKASRIDIDRKKMRSGSFIIPIGTILEGNIMITAVERERGEDIEVLLFTDNGMNYIAPIIYAGNIYLKPIETETLFTPTNIIIGIAVIVGVFALLKYKKQ